MAEPINIETIIENRGNGMNVMAFIKNSEKIIAKGGFFYHPENLDLTMGEQDRIIHVIPEYRSHGLGTKVGRKLIEIAFSLNFDPHPEFFSLSIVSENIPMIKVAEKLDFWCYEPLSSPSIYTYIKLFNPNT